MAPNAKAFSIEGAIAQAILRARKLERAADTPGRREQARKLVAYFAQVVDQFPEPRDAARLIVRALTAP